MKETTILYFVLDGEKLNFDKNSFTTQLGDDLCTIKVLKLLSHKYSTNILLIVATEKSIYTCQAFRSFKRTLVVLLKGNNLIQPTITG